MYAIWQGSTIFLAAALAFPFTTTFPFPAAFPFTAYFEAGGRPPLFTTTDRVADEATADAAWRAVRGVFAELAEVRPLELLKSAAARVRYLLTTQARIVAMTCTHAAIKRGEFLELGLK